MSKIRCLLLDDEMPGLTYLRMLCEQLPFVEVQKCFLSPQQLIAEAGNIDFNVCLLDINMPGISGLEVAAALKNKYVIFVSAHPEFAVDAYELEAIDFIKKPVTKDRLEKALLKAQKLVANTGGSEHFSWNTSLGKSIIIFDEIGYISTSGVDKRDKVAYMNDGRSLLLKNITIDKLVSLLPAQQFMQVNKAEIVSRKAIQAHTAGELTLRHSAKQGILLGEAYRKQFLDWIG